MDGLSDDYLTELLTEASDTAVAYTHQPEDLDEVWDSVIVEMAVIEVNRLGIEGTTTAKEGEMMRGYDSGIPAKVRNILNQYRLVVGLGGE